MKLEGIYPPAIAPHPAHHLASTVKGEARVLVDVHPAPLGSVESANSASSVRAE